jgi:hypothetical protein
MSLLGGIGDAIGGALGNAADLAGDVLTGDLTGAAGDLLDLTGDAAQLAGIAAPVVSMFNPLAGMALGAGSSVVGDLIGNITKQDAQQNKQNNFGKLTANAGAAQNAIGETAGVGGGDLFAQLAALVGEKLQQNVDSLIQKGKDIDAGGDKTFEGSSQFIGEQEKMKFVSQALGQLLPAVGQSLQNVSKA